MQLIELLLVSAGVIVASAVVATRERDVRTADRPWSRALLGIVPGLIGAGFILVASMDLLPDEWEASAWTITMIAVSAVAIIGVSFRLARR